MHTARNLSYRPRYYTHSLGECPNRATPNAELGSTGLPTGREMGLLSPERGGFPNSERIHYEDISLCGIIWGFILCEFPIRKSAIPITGNRPRGHSVALALAINGMFPTSRFGSRISLGPFLTRSKPRSELRQSARSAARPQPPHSVRKCKFCRNRR